MVNFDNLDKTNATKVPFNWPYMVGKELYYIAQAHFHGRLAGDGHFTEKCHQWLEDTTGSKSALLTHSCTAALEMASLLFNLQPGDEVIMPSYTFVSTANAIVLRGATPVFIDIREDTLNLDEVLLESAITPRTKAIIPVHYAGVGCEMDTIMAIASKNQLFVLEDAAQGIMAKYKGRALGSIGHLGAFSFHETKNIISGEGGAILVNDTTLVSRAETIREKGTNRKQFFRGEVDKYTWQEIGSSYLPGELIAAFLWAQLEMAEEITKKRLKLWNTYHIRLKDKEHRGYLKRPFVPSECEHNAHMYYAILQNPKVRDKVINKLRVENIHAIFHYVPLHDSPAGAKYGRTSGQLPVTDLAAGCILRLPLWVGLDTNTIEHIVSRLENAIQTAA